MKAADLKKIQLQARKGFYDKWFEENSDKLTEAANSNLNSIKIKMLDLKGLSLVELKEMLEKDGYKVDVCSEIAPYEVEISW